MKKSPALNIFSDWKVSALLLAIIFLTLITSPKKAPIIPLGEPVPTIPAKLVERRDTYETYNSNPPSSGWYTEFKMRDGYYTEKLRDEQIVGALKQGKVVITYNCKFNTLLPTPFPRDLDVAESSPSAVEETAQDKEPVQSGEKKQTLQEAMAVYEEVNKFNRGCGEIVSTLREILKEKGEEDLVVIPRENLDARVALVSWGRIEKLRFVDKGEIGRFVDEYRGRKPGA